MVLDVTTEEGRIFHIGIVLGKNNFSGHNYKQDTLCTVIHVMPLFVLSLEPGSETYLYQETLYRSESCRRRLRKTAPCGSPGMATQVRQACRQRYWCFSISCRSTSQLSSVPSPPVQSEFHDRANQCFVCNFLSMPRCKGQIAPKKTQCLSCLSLNF